MKESLLGIEYPKLTIAGMVTEDTPLGGHTGAALSLVERAVEIHKFADPHEELGGTERVEKILETTIWGRGCRA